MSDAAGQLTDGVHLLRLEQRRLSLTKSALRFLLLRDVAGDLGKAEKCAVWRTNWIDNNMGPEATSILSDAPPFVLESTLPRRRLKGPLRLAPCAIFGRVELREMLAENFRTRYPLNRCAPGFQLITRPSGSSM